MITIYVDGDATIKFGHATDNNATRIAFPIAHTVEMFGSGTWQVINKRPGEAIGYPVQDSQLETDANYLYWTLSATDTAYSGTGECQLRYAVGDVVKMSYKWRTGVCASLVSGNAPTYVEAWLDELRDIKDDAEAAASDAEDASEAIQDMSVVANSVSSTSPATVTKTVDTETGAVTLTFGIPRGADGGNVYIAKYGETSFEEITSAFNSGKAVLCCRNDSQLKAYLALSNLLTSSATFCAVFDTTSVNYTLVRVARVTPSGWTYRNVQLQRYGETPSASIYNHHIELLESTETEPTTCIDLNLLSSSSTPITSTSQLFSTMENHPWTFLRGWYCSMGYSIMSIRLINSTIYMLVDEDGSLTEFTIRGFEGITDTVTTA